jgi:hypothetical protein
MTAAWLFLLLAAGGERSALETQPGGWTDIMPGPGLAGWTRLEPISTRGVVAKVHPEREVWVVDRKAGILDCRGHLPPAPAGGKAGSHEMLSHDRELGDFVFHVEWRFTDPARPGWNAGVYARASRDGKVWHQAQVGGVKAGYWFGDTPDGKGAIVRQQFEAREARVKPPGEWNTYEITARGPRMTLWVNGAVVAEWSGLRVLRGHVGLEAELHHNLSPNPTHTPRPRADPRRR